MKSILEITPDSRTAYEMPDEVYEIIARALRLRLVKKVKTALAILPEEMRAGVKITALPKFPEALRELEPCIVFVDEICELTTSEASNLTQNSKIFISTTPSTPPAGPASAP